MSREWSATVNKNDHAVTVTPAGAGRWTVTIDGVEREVDAQRVKPGTWSLIIGNRSYLIDVDPRKQGPVVLTPGTETPVSVMDARKKQLAQALGRGGGGASSGEEVTAPIAGKVVKVLVAEGDTVTAGQGLVVLEAMKMENEIKATADGVVKKVHIAAGASIETHAALISIAPS